MAMSLYCLAPFLGPTIGPMAGAWIAQEFVWRWVFWSSTIFAGLVQVLGLCFLKESTCAASRFGKLPTAFDCSIPTGPAGTQGKGNQEGSRRLGKRTQATGSEDDIHRC